MCGIAGYFSFKYDPPSEKVVKKMTDSLAHRGPDDQGVAMFPEGALGHRRLSIIDLSDGGTSADVLELTQGTLLHSF